MNIMSVADLHGRTCWKEPVQKFIKAQTDKEWYVIFTGDYFDSFTYSGPDQLVNAQEVVLLKEQHPDNVVLLLGNHDLGYYLPDNGYRCSGFQPRMLSAFGQFFGQHRKLFQIAWEIEAENTIYLFVHAGVQLDWVQHNQQKIDAVAGLLQAEKLSDILNGLLMSRIGQDTLYQVGWVNGGHNPFDGPVWVRPGQLSKSVLPGYTQVVGHTPLNKGIVRAIHFEETGEHAGRQTGVILTDCLHDGEKAEKNEFLTLTI